MSLLYFTNFCVTNIYFFNLLCQFIYTTNGVSIESVSKMLGHKKLQTTQHYAKILEKKVSMDMQTLKDKLKTVFPILKTATVV